MNDAPLKALVADIFDLSQSDITDHLNRDEVSAWDSLNHLRLITAVEQEFQISFSMQEIASIDSIAQLKELIRERLE